jgi:hypothetical protein
MLPRPFNVSKLLKVCFEYFPNREEFGKCLNTMGRGKQPMVPFLNSRLILRLGENSSGVHRSESPSDGIVTNLLGFGSVLAVAIKALNGG